MRQTRALPLVQGLKVPIRHRALHVSGNSAAVESFAASYHGGKNGVTGVLTTEADIQAIRNAMDGRPKVSLLPFALESPRDSACQIVLRPLAAPDSASSSASSPEGKKLRVEKAQKKVAERVETDLA